MRFRGPEGGGYISKRKKYLDIFSFHLRVAEMGGGVVMGDHGEM